MKPEIDPKVDYSFKRVFGREDSRPILKHMLNAVLRSSPRRIVHELEVRNPFNEKDYPSDKLSVVDIRVRDQHGRNFAVEMQSLVHAYLGERTLYYGAELYGQQLQAGQGYDELRPVIVICFLDGVLLKEHGDRWDWCFTLRDRINPGVQLTDHLELYLFELPKFVKQPEELKDDLEAWLYFLKHGAELDAEAMPAALQVPEIVQAMKELQNMAQNAQDLERYREGLKQRREEQLREKLEELALERGLQQGLERGLEQGMQRGLEQGKEHGVVQGLASGELVGRVHFCQRFLKQPLTPTEQLARLPLTELQQLAARMEQEVFGPPTP